VPTIGMPLRIKITNTNSGPSTFNPGSGLAPIVTASGSPLSGGELRSNMVYELMWNGTAYELMAPISTGLPAGTVTAFAGGSIPSGWLFSGGAALVRATYPDLFTAIGTIYGAVDGSHFNLPNLQGRVIACIDPSGTVLNSPYVTPNGNTIGATGGSQSETASVSVSGSSGVSVSGTSDGPSDNASFGTGPGSGVTVASQIHTHNMTSTGTVSITSSGATAVQTNVQPSMVMQYMIKAYN